MDLSYPVMKKTIHDLTTDDSISYEYDDVPEYPAVTDISCNDRLYPGRLANICGEKAPAVLHCMGNVSLLSREPKIMICGARNASGEALKLAYRCALEIAGKEGLVISGYARGVDMAAHKGALDSGGMTIAMLPYGIGKLKIHEESVPSFFNRFLVISELEQDYRFTTRNALRRNRMLAAMAHAVIVIEPGETGGTWYSASAAVDLGRPLFFMEGERRDTIDALERRGGRRIDIRNGEPDIGPVFELLRGLL
jgi:DNA processing protein